MVMGEEGNLEIFKNADGYEPLLWNLEGYWEKSLAELPRHLRTIVEKRYALYPWDDRNPEQRRSLAAQYDYQHDPNHEPATYFELVRFSDELKDWINTAREASKDAAVVALRDVADRIEKILDVDRERIGAEIQELRAKCIDADGLAQKPLPPASDIVGPTFTKLKSAIDEFDASNPPRSKKAFMASLEKMGCLTREQEVFADIVAEHYDHSWRT